MTAMRPIVVVLALLSLTGCAELLNALRGSLQPPRATFQRAELQAIDLDTATVAAVFELENPNVVGVSVAGVSYAFSLENKRLLDGQLPGGLQIPASGRTLLTVPVKVPFRAVADLATTLATRDEAPYTVDATATIRTSLGNVTVPLSWSGVLPIPHLPRISVVSARVENLSFTGARLLVSLAVDNRNSFALPLGALSGQVSVAGQPVAALGLPSARPLAAKSVSTIDLPIDVSFLSAGLAVSTALARGAAAIHVTGAATIADQQLPIDLSTELR